MGATTTNVWKTRKTMSINKFTVQQSFAISAGAGSGKTYTLSRRYINALVGFDYFREDYKTQDSYYEQLNPAKVNQIVTITYTEAAALEMKGRIFELVHKIIGFDTLSESDGDYKSIKEANLYLTNEQHEYVLGVLQEAYISSSNSKISTIHSFCLNIIKANADIARIDTKLDIIKEDEKQSELAKIIFDTLNDLKNKETVLDISKDISMFFVSNLIDKYVSNSKFRKDYDSFSSSSIDTLMYKKLINELYPIPNIDDALKELESDATRTAWLLKYYKGFIDFNAVAWKDVFEDEKTPSLGVKKFPETTLVKEQLEKRIGAYLEINLDNEEMFFIKVDKIKSLLHMIKKQYDDRIKELGKIDFDTIITKTLEIMPMVKTNFKYIMVDEFQDTNEIQFDIVRNAISNDTNLFVVGDSKQSIYSFQGAEIEVFNNAIKDEKLFSNIADMSKNHRSDGVVLDTVNKIFDYLLVRNENLKLISQNYEAEPQDLDVFKADRKEQGSFEYLITSQENKEEISELDTIASFVSAIYYGKKDKYLHITNLVKEKKRAIAILFDSSTKMLELKQKLREKGIVAKVSTTDNFYHTKEINDIFNTLKAIDILSKNKEKISDKDKFYLVAAMRSNIIRTEDNLIKKHLDSGTIPDKLSHYLELFSSMPLALFVKYIYDDSNLFGVYAHFDDIEQRIANLYKFLHLCKDYQDSNESSLHKFLKLIENAIYFSKAKEDEAFFKSENSKSVEICSIHSTKGLAYPLVLLGNSDKGLYSQITSDSLKHNNFTLNDVEVVKKEIVGFKINKYEPLSLRVLKEIDKLKHLAEKKRLLYVALTRAEHDIVISANLKQKVDGGISLREDSYLYMITQALDTDIDTLFQIGQRDKENNTASEEVILKRDIEYVEDTLEDIAFESKAIQSATMDSETYDEDASIMGSITHKIFELYWNKFDLINMDEVFNKFNIDDDSKKIKITKSIAIFKNSSVYKKLEAGANYKFELEFSTKTKHGFIDLVYSDNETDGWIIIDFKTGTETEDKTISYQKQLDFYEAVLVENGLRVTSKQLLWV